jgi:hypothetical protein
MVQPTLLYQAGEAEEGVDMVDMDMEETAVEAEVGEEEVMVEEVDLSSTNRRCRCIS